MRCRLSSRSAFACSRVAAGRPSGGVLRAPSGQTRPGLAETTRPFMPAIPLIPTVEFSAPVRKLAGRTISRSGSSTVSVNRRCQAVSLSTCQGVKLNFDQLQLAAPRAAAPRDAFGPAEGPIKLDALLDRDGTAASEEALLPVSRPASCLPLVRSNMRGSGILGASASNFGTKGRVVVCKRPASFDQPKAL
jgi:hypothetical protein